MKMVSKKVRITLTTPCLGTNPGNPETLSDFIVKKLYSVQKKQNKVFKNGQELTDAEKAEFEKEELTAAEMRAKLLEQGEDGTIEKATTFHPQDENGVFEWDYYIRGFFKESLVALVQTGSLGGNLSKYGIREVIDRFCFLKERKVYWKDANGNPITDQYSQKPYERPLRASTLQGDRVALARSTVVPEGSTMEFTVMILEGDKSNPKSKTVDWGHIKEALDYGMLKGLGQWRSGGFGRFTWEEIG